MSDLSKRKSCRYILLTVGFITAISFLLRIFGLSSYPSGFHADEATFGYDAYSLIKTGKDQWGQSWPLIFRSFGDFKLPAYGYLAIPAVAIFGLNEFSTRLPGAIFGTLAVLATYLLASKLFSDRRVGLLGSFLLAISPWHVSLSRGAFEANLTTFFLTFGTWSFLKGLEKPRWMFVCAFSFGINLFTYHSARFFTILFLVFLIWLYREKTRFLANNFYHFKYLAAVVVILVFLSAAAYTMFAGASKRGIDIVITNPTDKWEAVVSRRYEGILLGLSPEISRLASNKPLYILDQFLSNYTSYLSPQFLFTNGAEGWSYGMVSGRGVLYLIEVLFLVFAVVMFSRGNLPKGQILILFWIVFSLLPAALTKGSGYAGNRAAVMMPAVQIFSAFGGVVLFDFLNIYIKPLIFRKLLLPAYVAVLFLSLIFFLEDYIYHAPINGAQDMLYGRKAAFVYLQTVESSYEEIRVSRVLTESQIFVAFYKSWDPVDYQSYTRDWLRYEKQGYTFLDQLDGYRLGKYVFGDLHYETGKILQKIAFVGKPDEFPLETVPVYQVKYPDGKPAIYIVNSSKSDDAK